ncbi:YfcC family protein [Ferrimonas lipolytica]|uniref:YfcC family protein n=1 Tax=Ferrimonas lipolytica TaxID=2724191 RepID=A0A6H1UES3_9GAMM|nr:Na+/H+ antiporter NhaC family protein [Ferrimonas lipolytica]QIZ77129.1 YfcC family protein [Ferrimonas lipolytica]
MPKANTLPSAAQMSALEQSAKGVNHPFLSLIIMVIVAAIATYIIPAGEFERVAFEGRTIVNPDSFTPLASNPTTVAGFFEAFFAGFKSAAGVMGVVLFVGGAFGVMKYMGVLDAAVYGLTEKLKERGLKVIAPIVMTAIAINVTFTGMRELDVIFITLMIPICIKLGYDAITALGIVLLSSCAGFAAALANPFFTGIAHNIAELPIYSGMWYRAIFMVFMLLTGMAYVLHYAAKIKADPTKSLLHGSNYQYDTNVEVKSLSGREKAAGVSFLLIFGYMIYGTLAMSFGFTEMAGCFMAAAMIPGIIGGLSANKICDYWTRGASDVLVAALIIFFARSIMSIMEDAKIIDSIIFYLSQFLIGGSELVSAAAIYITQGIINLIIPSGSGQAVITMPIIVPLADMGGVTRQVAALASQLGDGISNYIYPTNGGLLAVLALARIPYGKWVKFFLPLFLFWTGAALIAVIIAQMIGLGPF